MHRFAKAAKKTALRLRQKITGRVRRTGSPVTKRGSTWWRAHRDRMTEDASYAEMLIDLVVGAVDLLVDSLRVRYLVRAATSAYLWILRAMRPYPMGGLT